MIVTKRMMQIQIIKLEEEVETLQKEINKLRNNPRRDCALLDMACVDCEEDDCPLNK